MDPQQMHPDLLPNEPVSSELYTDPYPSVEMYSEVISDSTEPVDLEQQQQQSQQPQQPQQPQQQQTHPQQTHDTQENHETQIRDHYAGIKRDESRMSRIASIVSIILLILSGVFSYYVDSDDDWYFPDVVMFYAGATIISTIIYCPLLACYGERWSRLIELQVAIGAMIDMFILTGWMVGMLVFTNSDTYRGPRNVYMFLAGLTVELAFVGACVVLGPHLYKCAKGRGIRLPCVHEPIIITADDPMFRETEKQRMERVGGMGKD